MRLVKCMLDIRRNKFSYIPTVMPHVNYIQCMNTTVKAVGTVAKKASQFSFDHMGLLLGLAIC